MNLLSSVPLVMRPVWLASNSSSGRSLYSLISSNQVWLPARKA